MYPRGGINVRRYCYPLGVYKVKPFSLMPGTSHQVARLPGYTLGGYGTSRKKLSLRAGGPESEVKLNEASGAIARLVRA
jgi:hypothetical protein